MREAIPAPLRVFVDADVLFAGAASPSRHSASQVILTLSEITIIDAMTSQQALMEVERNLEKKLPTALPIFRLLVSRSLQVTATPEQKEIEPYRGLADSKDLPILVAALQNECPWLVTFNGRHFQPGHTAVTTLTPGQFIQRLRYLLTNFSSP
ncbi:MAG: PIN domain-containing protein [Anaerolineales bacterium]|nr:PIN domain-containing protein [Anaerolineales bacterium]